MATAAEGGGLLNNNHLTRVKCLRIGQTLWLRQGPFQIKVIILTSNVDADAEAAMDERILTHGSHRLPLL